MTDQARPASTRGWRRPSRPWNATAGGPDRSRLDRARGAPPGRVLRHANAPQPGGRHQRPRGPPDRDPAVGPQRARRHREGHPEAATSGLMPNVDGTVVRLNIPPLTEERRRDLVKVVHRRMEEARVEIRNHRREASDEPRRQEREGELGSDDARREQERIEKTTDRVDRRGRPRGQAQGAGDPGGLVAARTGHSATLDATPPTRCARTAENPVPRHVAIIMDGNRRWARDRGVPTPQGHAAGVEAIRPDRASAPSERGVEVLSHLRLQPRELGTRAGGGPDPASRCSTRPSATTRPTSSAQGVRVRCWAASTSCRRPPGVDRGRAGGHGGRHPHDAQRGFNYSGRSELVDAVRRCVEDGLRRVTSRLRTPSPRACIRRTCRTPTS